MLAIRRFNAHQKTFQKDFKAFLEARDEHQSDVSQSVQEIITQVRRQGDSALLAYTRQFDRLEVGSADQLEIPQTELQQALASIGAAERRALRQAHQRIQDYAQHQPLESWQYSDSHGNLLGQKITALDRVGIYVPGGSAAYPSSVLMNAVPAKIAGVADIVMAAPAPAGKVNQTVLAAAALAGVDRVFRIGGAQAIAALAYGTRTVPNVDKIVGPGNIYVATAKRMVFGKVGIDMIAGPSEVLVICDDSADPQWIARDLFSQAEHDVLARALLISNSEDMLHRVEQAMNALLPGLERREIIRKAIESFGCFVKVETLAQAAGISNQVAPEHLQLSLQDAGALLAKIQHAGAVFIGQHTPEVFGDYCAGPNHVLPTSATARFSSPLGVYDFQKRTSILNCSQQGAAKLSSVASTLAHSEGVSAHARSAEFRDKL